MKRTMTLSTMIGMAAFGAFVATPASAQAYPAYGANYGGGHGGQYREAEYRGVSRHDHYAAWVTQQRKLRVQRERWARQQHHQYRADGPQDRWDQDGRRGDDRYRH